MRFQIGKSDSLWRVNSARLSPYAGILISFSVLFLTTFISSTYLKPVSVFSSQVEALRSSWQEVKIIIKGVTQSGKQAIELEQLVSKLQQQNDEAKKLNTRLASKIDNIQGAISGVTKNIYDSTEKKKQGDKSNRSRRLIDYQEDNQVMFHPASLTMKQRVSVKRIDKLLLQLKRLPLKSPTLNPVINSSFGARVSPNGIGSSYHHGIDLSLKDSNIIMAAGNSIVEQVGYMRGYGLYIDLRHSKDIVTRYAHLASVYVKQNQKILAGQIIAKGGSSGTSTGKHLHYEVLIKGRARDPMYFLTLPQKLQLAIKEISQTVG